MEMICLRKNGKSRELFSVLKPDQADFGEGFSFTKLETESLSPRQRVRHMTPTSFSVQLHARLSRLHPRREKANNLQSQPRLPF
jgi:hypothetical protein